MAKIIKELYIPKSWGLENLDEFKLFTSSVYSAVSELIRINNDKITKGE